MTSKQPLSDSGVLKKEKENVSVNFESNLQGQQLPNAQDTMVSSNTANPVNGTMGVPTTMPNSGQLQQIQNAMYPHQMDYGNTAYAFPYNDYQHTTNVYPPTYFLPM